MAAVITSVKAKNKSAIIQNVDGVTVPIGGSAELLGPLTLDQLRVSIAVPALLDSKTISTEIVMDDGSHVLAESSGVYERVFAAEAEKRVDELEAAPPPSGGSLDITKKFQMFDDFAFMTVGARGTWQWQEVLANGGNGEYADASMLAALDYQKHPGIYFLDTGVNSTGIAKLHNGVVELAEVMLSTASFTEEN